MVRNRVEDIAAGQATFDSFRGERIAGIPVEWNSSMHPARSGFVTKLRIPRSSLLVERICVHIRSYSIVLTKNNRFIFTNDIRSIRV